MATTAEADIIDLCDDGSDGEESTRATTNTTAKTTPAGIANNPTIKSSPSSGSPSGVSQSPQNDHNKRSTQKISGDDSNNKNNNDSTNKNLFRSSETTQWKRQTSMDGTISSGSAAAAVSATTPDKEQEMKYSDDSDDDFVSLVRLARRKTAARKSIPGKTTPMRKQDTPRKVSVISANGPSSTGNLNDEEDHNNNIGNMRKTAEKTGSSSPSSPALSEQPVESLDSRFRQADSGEQSEPNSELSVVDESNKQQIINVCSLVPRKKNTTKATSTVAASLGAAEGKESLSIATSTSPDTSSNNKQQQNDKEGSSNAQRQEIQKNLKDPAVASKKNNASISSGSRHGEEDSTTHEEKKDDGSSCRLDGNSSGDQQLLLLQSKIDYWKCHCWKCEVQLRHPEEEEKERDSGEMCCYALHSHPLLEIPVCCVCSEEVDAAMVEQQQQLEQRQGESSLQQEHTDEDYSFCCACGESEEDVEVLFLCDTPGCRHAVCGTCVQRAHQQEGIVEQLNGSSDPWKCCHCRPPAFLQKLKDDLKLLQEKTISGKSIEELLTELECVEEKKRECIEQLENSEKVREEIHRELTTQDGSNIYASSEEELEEKAQEEFDAWKTTQEQHDRRLADMIAILQDELGTLGFDLYEYYGAKRAAERESAGCDNDEYAAWKIAADMEVSERISKKSRLITMLENRENVIATLQNNPKQKKTEIRERLKKELGLKDSSPHLDELVEGELRNWIDDQNLETRRHESAISNIQNELENIGFNKQEFYRAKQAAENDDDSDIEDLGSLSSDDVHRSAKEIERRIEQGWVTNIVPQKCFQIALAAEERKLKGRKLAGVREADDRISMKKEDQQRSRSRVRSDHKHLRQQQKKEVERTKARRKQRQEGKRCRAAVAADVDRGDDSSVISVSSSLDESPENIEDVRARNSLFKNSSFILSEGDDKERYPLSVASALAEKLKQHQRDGINFIFENCFADLAYRNEDEAEKIRVDAIGGCVLAHNMGLGKTLTCVALLHMLHCHPSFNRPVQKKRPVNTVLLLVPKVTVTNWEDEFEKWVGSYGSKVPLYSFQDEKSSRRTLMKKWCAKGGVLLMSIGVFLSTTKDDKCLSILQEPGPDAIVLDEAHQMLKNSSNKTFHALMQVKTKRRLCLTGSPFQNNLFEYFRMISYVRPGVLGSSEKTFEKTYINPIIAGSASDAPKHQKKEADQRLADIQELVKPHVHRVDRSVLLRDLPPMQQVVLHFRQTKVQSKLYSAFKKHSRNSYSNEWKNFLRIYHELRPIHNHPGCLLRRSRDVDVKKPPISTQRRSSNSSEIALPAANEKKDDPNDNVEKPEKTKKPASKDNSATKKIASKFSAQDIIDLISDSEDDDGAAAATDYDLSDDKTWWENLKFRDGETDLNDFVHSNKVVMLLHILVHADTLNEKVVVFSQCLKTLDFLSEVFSTPDWSKRVPSLSSAFPDSQHGGWKCGVDFLRIDGGVSGVDRGDRVKEFNESLSLAKVFLISPRSGGVGINLCAANRVVLFDSNFNPTTDEQALYRCYRYGQTKSVFVYRFLVEGTMEEKVYTRAVTKTGLALRLLDGKNIERVFTRKELEDFTENYQWVCCDKCNKWRIFPPECNVDAENLPPKWYCEMMNQYDQRMVLSCKFPEKSQYWYTKHFSKPNERPLVQSPLVTTMDGGGKENKKQSEKERRLVERDTILKGLLEVSCSDTNSKVLSRHYFHDVLLEEKDLDVPKKSSVSKEQIASPNTTRRSTRARTTASPNPESGRSDQVRQATAKAFGTETKLPEPRKRGDVTATATTTTKANRDNLDPAKKKKRNRETSSSSAMVSERKKDSDPSKEKNSVSLFDDASSTSSSSLSSTTSTDFKTNNKKRKKEQQPPPPPLPLRSVRNQRRAHLKNTNDMNNGNSSSSSSDSDSDGSAFLSKIRKRSNKTKPSSSNNNSNKLGSPASKRTIDLQTTTTTTTTTTTATTAHARPAARRKRFIKKIKKKRTRADMIALGSETIDLEIDEDEEGDDGAEAKKQKSAAEKPKKLSPKSSRYFPPKIPPKGFRRSSRMK